MAITPEVLVAPVQANATPRALRPKVVALSDNRFLVAFSTETGSSSGRYRIHGQVFDYDGNRIGSQLLFPFDFISGGEKKEIDEERFSISTMGNGKVVIGTEMRHFTAEISTRTFRIDEAGTIQSMGDQFKLFSNQGTGPSNPEVIGFGENRYRFIYAFLGRIRGTLKIGGFNGGTLLREKRITQYTSHANTTIDADVLTNGNLIVLVDPDGDGRRRGQLHLYLLQQDGTTIRDIIGGSEDGRTFHAKVIALTGGGFVIAFAENDGGDINIVYRVYKQNGDPLTTNLGAGIDTNGTGDNNNNEPAIVPLPDGGFILFYDKDRGLSEFRGRRYNAAGSPIGGDFRVAAERSAQPDAALLEDGRVAVAYHVSGSEIVKVAILNGMPEVIRGTDAADTLLGTDDDDVILGFGGDDTLSGRDGFDQLDGGAGDDVVTGGGGADIVRGGPGADTLFGFSGNDFLEGGTGNDVLDGGQGADRFIFVDDDGVNEIRDFDASPTGDRIDLRAVSRINSFADLRALYLNQTNALVSVAPGGEVVTTQAEELGDVVIDDGVGLRIILKGIDIADLTASNFIF